MQYLCCIISLLYYIFVVLYFVNSALTSAPPVRILCLFNKSGFSSSIFDNHLPTDRGIRTVWRYSRLILVSKCTFPHDIIIRCATSIIHAFISTRLFSWICWWLCAYSMTKSHYWYLQLNCHTYAKQRRCR